MPIAATATQVLIKRVYESWGAARHDAGKQTPRVETLTQDSINSIHETKEA